MEGMIMQANGYLCIVTQKFPLMQDGTDNSCLIGFFIVYFAGILNKSGSTLGYARDDICPDNPFSISISLDSKCMVALTGAASVVEIFP